MEIVVDNSKFNDYQETVIKCIIESIRSTLENREVKKEIIEDLTGTLAFGVAAIIDSSQDMGTGKNPVLPFLTFSKDFEDKDTLIVNNKGGSYMHELVYGCIDDVFKEEYNEDDLYP